jgi:hypothetical protein
MINDKNNFAKIKVGIISVIISIIISFVVGLSFVNIFYSNEKNEKGDISLLYKV